MEDTPITSQRYAQPAPAPRWEQRALPPGAHPHEGEAPLMHFGSGAPSPYRRELLRAFSDERDYRRASRMVGAPEERLTPFQTYNLQWILAVVRGDGAERFFRKQAKDAAATPDELAVYEENRVFQLLHDRDLPKARWRAREALMYHPTSHGLWVNLLVAMTRGEEHDTVEKTLLELPRILEIDRGFLGVYLLHEPDLGRPVCNGG